MSLIRVIAVVMVLLSSVTATAQEKAPAAPAAKLQLDEATQKALDKVKSSFQGVQSYEYSAQTSIKVDAQGMKQDSTTAFKVAVKRPNKFVIEATGGRMDGLTLLSDGKNFYLYSAQEKAYSKQDAPERLSKLAEEGYIPSDPLLGFVTAFVEDDPVAPILEGVTSGKFAGKEAVDKAETERMHFVLSDMEWDLWVGAGEKPLPVRLKPDVSKSLAQQDPQMGAVKVDMNVTYADWSLGKDVPDERFVFKPAEGSQEMVEPKSPLEGQVAPTFSADMLDGKKMDLAQHKGKDVVILDFWATYCQPCRILMPMLDKVVKEFKGKNVAYYAVNGSEDAATIRPFMENIGLDVPVVLDADSSISQKYQVEGIPMVVIVGKDGVIRNVQVGVGGGAERKLRNMIKAAAEAK
jgi:peroxiredoxin